MNKVYMDAVRDLKAGKISPVYILLGEEDYLRGKFLDLLRKTIVDPGMEDFNFEHYQASEVSGAAVADKASSLPVMADWRLVIVENCSQWKKKDTEQVTKYLDAINDKAVMVLQFKDGDRRRKLFSSKDPQVRYLEFPRPKPWELGDYIIGLVREEGLKLTPDACTLVAELAGDDLSRVHRELEKLSIYKPEGEITGEDVAALMGRTRLATRWELNDFIGKRDLHGVLLKVQHIIDSGGDAIGLLSAVNNHLKQLYSVKALLVRGIRDKREIASIIRLPPKITEGLMNQQKNYSNLELRNAFALMAETDVRLKSSRLSGRVLIDQLLTQIVVRGPYSPPKARGRR